MTMTTMDSKTKTKSHNDNISYPSLSLRDDTTKTTTTTTQHSHFSVASVALEAEIDDCRQRLVSGETILTIATEALTTTTTTTNSRRGNNYSRNPPQYHHQREIAVRSFVEAFASEVQRLGKTLTNEWKTVESSAEALLKDIVVVDDDGQRRNNNNALLQEEKCISLRKRAHEVQTESIKIMQEVTKNKNELLRIAVKADAKLGTDCVDESEREFFKKPWTDSGSLSRIVKLLSDIFNLLRELEQTTNKESNNNHNNNHQWIAPQSFERVTTKYWVREEHLAQVLLMSAGELPLLMYGKSELLLTSERDDDDFWKSSAVSQISSVYFDSSLYSLYHERLKRSEGAQLVRVRWYGKSKPHEDAPVFLELKTHHESWIDNRSVKERVTILQKRVADLIDISDGPWTKEYAMTLVQEAPSSFEPNNDNDVISTSAELLVEIRNLFLKHQLQPCVRTSYTRAAFQCRNNNHLRMTIDRDITVIDERMAREDNNSITQTTTTSSKSSHHSWCIDDDDVVPIEAFAKVPYCVFEVKVVSEATASDDDDNDDRLQFVQELEANDVIVEVPKFSKFLTGASLHNVNNVETLPWWSEDELFAPMYKRKVDRSSDGKSSILDMFVGKGTPLVVDHRQHDDDDDDDNLSDADDNEGKSIDFTALEEGRTTTNNTITNHRTSSANGNGFGMFRRMPSATTKPRSSAGAGLFQKAKKVRFRNTNFWTGKGISSTTLKTAALRSPARVEPKSFFANERTFIQWITVASLFIFVAGLVYTAGLSLHDDGDVHTARGYLLFGSCLIACAMFVVVYGVAVYYRRLFLMIHAKPYGYSDTFGPAVLGIFMITLLSVFVYVYYLQFEQPSASLREVPGVCVRRNLIFNPSSGISYLKFEPSAVVVDTDRNLLIVASLDEIVALPAGLPTNQTSIDAPFRILYRFEEGTEDLEALEIVNGTIYAISEGKRSSSNGNSESDIISLDWTDDGFLDESNRWRIKADYAEAMTYVSDPNWFGAPYMVVAADLRDLVPKKFRLEVLGFRLPFSANERQLNKRHLNNKFFVQNLQDTKVADMQFFGGLLYMLYNNEKIIRAYDSYGKLVNEWKLPVAETYYDEMWEGMRLEQNDDELYLHLTLDSPPHVWTIKLDGDTSPKGIGSGQWKLPSCAS